MKKIGALEAGGTKMVLGIFDETGKELDRLSLPTLTPDITVPLMQDFFRKHEISALGIGSFGPLELNPTASNYGSITSTPKLAWRNYPLLPALLDGRDIPAAIDTDVNAAVLAEAALGAAKGLSDVVYITVGTGVGGGVIINEKIIPGSDGAAGEIGHLRVKERETETCGCGNHGCLEQYASATGIARVTKKYLEEHDDETILRNTPELTAKAIFDAAKLGDEVAIKMVDETAKILAKGLSLVACVVNPQVFVIGGGMSKAGDFLIEQVQKYYQEYAFHACKNTFFKLADLGNDAGIYGCVRMIIK